MLLTVSSYLLAFFLGAIVGAAEIISRYRDEPFKVLSYPASLAYLILNGAVSVLAYALIGVYGQVLLLELQAEAPDNWTLFGDSLLQALAAGLGSSAVLRSRFLSFKTDGGEEYSIGLDALVSTFLKALDRSVDRRRATRRQDLVFRAVREIRAPERATEFLRSSLHSYQNLSEDEKSAIITQIDGVRAEMAGDAQMQLTAVLFGFLNIGGEDNFRNLVEHLKHQTGKDGGEDGVEAIDAKELLR